VLGQSDIEVVGVTNVQPTAVAMEYIGPEGHRAWREGEGLPISLKNLHPFNFSSIATAAAVSASCFELPVALASPAGPRFTETVKRGA
jgi:hypothetical protein